ALDLVAVVLDHLNDHLLALNVCALALAGLLAGGDGVVELLLVDVAVVAREGVDEVLDLVEDPAFDDVAVGVADLGEGAAGGVDGDPHLDRLLEDLTLLVLVDVLVVVGAQLDLFHEPLFNVIEGHPKAPLLRGGWAAPEGRPASGWR